MGRKLCSIYEATSKHLLAGFQGYPITSLASWGPQKYLIIPLRGGTVTVNSRSRPILFFGGHGDPGPHQGLQLENKASPWSLASMHLKIIITLSMYQEASSDLMGNEQEPCSFPPILFRQGIVRRCLESQRLKDAERGKQLKGVMPSLVRLHAYFTPTSLILV
jgi:hypothetical protein